uniref:NADH-ubiquinone oxidoreductase chain 6 n=1 Tax=Chlorotetraedron incus TaxID=162317 RepID=A0A076VKF8_9CHLO|nr:NADH dehydrogenase subunit 6 [Chlorotetraedron incus]AIK29111.1 NADH dehydrogenase subunit 6 [Chlorotetraedron incus]
MDLLFMLFASGCWASAILMLRSKNPVYSVFYLVLIFLHASGLLCLLGLEYFALLQLLVYVGALAIMFLFVVMLLDIPATEILAHQRGSYPVAGVLLLALTVSVFFALVQPDPSSPFQTPLFSIVEQYETFLPDWNLLTNSKSNVVQLGIALYGVHIDLLLLASLLLLVAMVGAVALTLKRRAQAPVHDVFVQHSVDFQKDVYSVTGKK